MIRQANSDDMKEILRLYKAGLDELGMEWKEDCIVKKITESFCLAPCFLVEIDGKLVGMAGFTLAITSHDGVATLCDYMFYVDPDYRNIKTLGGLVEEAKQFAIVHKLPLKLEFICDGGDYPLRARMFRRHGLQVYSVTGGLNVDT